jgi:hypothetical protein
MILFYWETTSYIFCANYILNQIVRIHEDFFVSKP